jgi:hypothetical protein
MLALAAWHAVYLAIKSAQQVINTRPTHDHLLLELLFNQHATDDLQHASCRTVLGH